MKKHRSAFILEKLEPRLLLSADMALLPIDMPISDALQSSVIEVKLPAQEMHNSTQEHVSDSRHEVIFIDSAVEDYQQLFDDIQTQAAEGRQFETVLLDSNTDGITQISNYLSSQQNISAVHIISHGSDGEVVLGDSPLNLATLDSYAESIESWQQSLTEEADLLFYGCNLASGTEGLSLISSLSFLTGADVAASDDATGQATLGGDWELEYATGQIETSIAFSSDAQQTWDQLLDDTVADNFSNIAYDGSDGTQLWSNDWQEINESDGAGAGNMQVYDRLSWGRGLYIWKSHVGAWREVDLSGAVAATLSFDVATSGLDAGDSVTLEISTDGGGAWDVIDTYDSNSGLQAASYDISAYIDSDTQIKFESTTFGDNDEFFVDNLQINFTNGLTSTSEFLVNTPDIGNPQETSAESRGSEQAVAMDSSGHYVVVWSSLNQDGSGWGVFAQRYNDAGNPLGGEFQITETTSDNQLWARIAMDGTGNFTVTWTSENQDGTTSSVYARQFNSAGNPLGAEFRVNTENSGAQSNSSIAMAADGRFVVTWEGEGSGDTDGIYFRRFNADGSARDISDQLVNSGNRGAETNAVASMNDSGEFAIAWEVAGEIYLRPFNDDGSAMWSESKINGFTTSSTPALAMNSDGKVTVVWRSENFIHDGIWLQIYDSADESLLPGAIQVDQNSVEDSTNPSISMDIAGNCIVTYEGSGDGNGLGVYGRKYDSSGSALGDEFLINETISGIQHMVSTAMLDINNFVAVWSGEGNTADDNGIYARQFNTNSAPAASDDNYSTNEDTAFTATLGVDDLLQNDTDPDGDTLTVNTTPLVDVSNGTLALTADGTFTYTPDADFNGSDTFTYEISDGNGGTDTATVNITVDPVNDAPTATNMGVTVLYVEDTPLDLTDITISDVDSPNVTAILTLSDPNAGSLSTATSGSVSSSFVASTGTWVASGAVADVNMLLSGVTFTPALNYDSVFSISTSVDDGVAAPITGTITVNSTPVNDAGNFTGDTGATIDEDTSASGTLTFSDTADGATTPSYRIEAGDEASNGSAAIDSASGAWTYTPAANFNGSDSFTVSVTDDDGYVETQVINITVTAVTDLSAADDSFSTNEDTPLVDSVATNDSTISGGTLSYVLDTGVSNGSLTLNNDGSFTYTPDADFNGSDSFNYTVTDADSGESSTQNVAITVNPVNDLPIISAISDQTIDEDSSTGALGFGVSDVETAAGSLTVTASSNDTTLIPNVNLTLVNLGGGNWTIEAAPAANMNGGPVTITVTVDDGTDTTDETFTVTVNPVDDPTTFGGNINGSGAEDGGDITGTLTASDSADGMTTPNFTVSAVAANGTVGIDNVTGDWTYAPNANFNGSDSFTVQVTDDDGNNETQVISISVTAVTDLSAADDSFSTNEDTALVDSVATNDSTTSGGILSYAVNTGVSNGSLTLNNDGSFTYTPDADFNGSDSFNYTVIDADSGESDTRTVNITVDPVNDSGSFTGDTGATIDEDTSTSGILTFTDLSDGDSGPNFRIEAGDEASNGTASIDASGNWTYTPNSNFNGSDSFIVSVTDDDGNNETQVISISVTAVTDLSAADDSFSTNEDTALVDSVATNDSTTSGGILSYALNTDVSNGVLGLNADGSFTYTPDADFNGSDSFSYTVTDADSGESDTRTVNITVDPVNDTGIFGGNLGSTIDEDISASGTLTFADTRDGASSPNFRIEVGDEASNGTAAIDNATGAWTYTPAANFNGSDNFTVSVTDDDGNNEIQVISISVTAVADLTADDDSFSTNEDTPLVDSVAANDSTTSGGILSYALNTDVSNGVLSLNADGSFTYTPTADFNGSDSFSYTVTDADSGESDTRTVNITVDPINDAATVSSANQTLIETNAPLTTTGTLTSSDVDNPDNSFTANTIVGTIGTFTIDAAGAWSFTANSAFDSLNIGDNVSEVFNVTSIDGTASSVTIQIDGSNETPTADNDNLSTAEDNSLSINTIADLLSNDSDPEGGTITLSGFTQPAHGILNNNSDGTLSYTPDSNFNGTDSFDYTINDGQGESATGKAYIVVSPVGDTPRVENVSVLAGQQTDPIVISRHTADGIEVTHFRISGINGGTLYQTDGTTRINNGEYITVAQGQAGLRFTADEDATSGSFNVESSENGVSVAGQSGAATSTITIIPATVIVPDTTLVEATETVGQDDPATEPDAVEKETNEDSTIAAALLNTPTAEMKPASEINKTTSNQPFAVVIKTPDSFSQDLSLAGNSQTREVRQTLNLIVEKLSIDGLQKSWANLDIKPLSLKDYDLVRSSFESLDNELQNGSHFDTVIISSTVATSIGLSAGYVVWMLKGGSLLASVLSSMPAWHLADPLSILSGMQRDDDDDEESLESILKDSESDEDEAEQDKEH